MELSVDYLAVVANSTLRMMTPILLVTLAAAICTKVRIFNIAMEGEALGVSKCEYVILKEKLKEYEESKIVTIEELIVLRKLSKLINKGIYEVINDLIKWYSERKPEDKLLYYQLLEDKIYYNLKE